MAFVNDDEIEKLNRNFGVVFHHSFSAAFANFKQRSFFRAFIKLLATENRIHTLDGGNADLAIGRHITGFQTLHGVKVLPLPVAI
jgi:hypothetical protein